MQEKSCQNCNHSLYCFVYSTQNNPRRNDKSEGCEMYKKRQLNNPTIRNNEEKFKSKKNPIDF